MIGDYSHGMRKKLSLAAAMLHRPALLLLDEPFEGVDPVSALTVRRVLDRYRHAGGVVVSSHVMEVLQRFCDRVAIIDRGRCSPAGPLDELAATAHHPGGGVHRHRRRVAHRRAVGLVGRRRD